MPVIVVLVPVIVVLVAVIVVLMPVVVVLVPVIVAAVILFSSRRRFGRPAPIAEAPPSRSRSTPILIFQWHTPRGRANKEHALQVGIRQLPRITPTARPALST